MRKSITASIFALCSISAQARLTMTITCSEPKGPRIDYISGTFVDKKDRFEGVIPTFIFDDEKPHEANVLFGPTQWAKDAGYDSGAFEALVLVQNSEQITLIASTGTHIGEMYSIFPKKGIGYFTLHKYLPFQDGIPSTATFISKCKVATNDP